MTQPIATRGARKLQAAIGAFAIAPRIAGARAIDVGASTGGFTATLLALGAREVTAIDVGRGQLAASLREDPRVRVHERTDFRRAPLSLAEGPFEFFTVDVSFMAARNVLRALAFRLAPGAEGVVLLKPQFELPPAQVRGGDVSDPELRSRAFARFEARAHKLGFRVLAHRDSEVTGGSGTVEIPLHLRFDGRPDSLPRPGERRAAVSSGPRRARASGAPEMPNWFAIAAPGIESALAQELAAIPGVIEPREQPGGVEFRGELRAGYAVNLHSRMATRVLVRLGESHAREFGELRRRLSRLPFAPYLRPDLPLRVDVTARRCRLYHTKALAQTLALAAGDALGAELELARGATAGEDAVESGARLDTPFGREPLQRLLLRGEQDRFTVSVDSSGLLLHRRGARAETGRAPLRETLAAAALELAGYRGEEPLVNAMCGAGTIALEAVDIALARAPGRMRAFAFEAFPCFSPEQLAQLRVDAERAQRSALAAPIHAFDSDAAVLETARRNAQRADAERHLQLQRADLLVCAPPEPGGLLIANPPYGKRLGHTREVRTLYRRIGERLRAAWRGYRVALLVPRDAGASAFGLRGARSFALHNGGLPIQLLVAEIAARR